jgi:MFS family permease
VNAIGASAHPLREVSELRAGGRLLVASMLGAGLSFPSVPFYSIGLFAPVLAREFAWSFAGIFAGLAIASVVALLVGPFAGYLVDRWGGRLIAAVTLVGFGLSYMSLALSSGSIIQFYLSWVLMAATGVGTGIAVTRAINAFFVARRGLALGITLAGVGLFAFGVKPLGAWLITILGWRGAFAVIGFLPLSVGACAVLWGLPRVAAGPSAGKGSPARQAGSSTGLSGREALRSRVFWTLLVAFTLAAFAIGGPLPNMENVLRVAHMNAHDVIALASVIGISQLTGRLGAGWLVDRAWAPLIGAVVLIAAALGSLALSQSALDYHASMLAIAGLGLAGGVEIDLLSYLIARYLGLRRYGLLYGAMYGGYVVSASFAPSIFARAFDRTGSYAQALHVGAILLVLAALTLLTLGRYPRT